MCRMKTVMVWKGLIATSQRDCVTGWSVAEPSERACIENPFCKFKEIS